MLSSALLHIVRISEMATPKSMMPMILGFKVSKDQCLRVFVLFLDALAGLLHLDVMAVGTQLPTAGHMCSCRYTGLAKVDWTLLTYTEPRPP